MQGAPKYDDCKKAAQITYKEKVKTAQEGLAVGAINQAEYNNSLANAKKDMQDEVKQVRSEKLCESGGESPPGLVMRVARV